MILQVVLNNSHRYVLLAVLGMALPAVVGCDKIAPLKSAKAKLDQLKGSKPEGTPAVPVAPGSAPVSASKSAAAPTPQTETKPEVEQFSKGWLPPGMSRGDVKPPQSVPRPAPAHKP